MLVLYNEFGFAMLNPLSVGSKRFVLVLTYSLVMADSSSTGRVVSSSTVVVVWMATPFMVVASMRNWSEVQLMVKEELLFLVWRGAPSCKELTSSDAHNYIHFDNSDNRLGIVFGTH